MVNLPPPALSFTQIKKQARDLVEKHGVDPKKMFIRGLTKMGFFTIKSMGKDLDSVYDTMEEYLSNRVHDTAKLRDFYSVEIMIFNNITTDKKSIMVYDEAAKQKKRAYYLANREKRIEYARTYYQANAASVIEKNTAYAARRKGRVPLTTTPEEATTTEDA
ncbi:hypothetical protein AaE_015018 [Aphanomyces astaci]|uniref:Uncharacterized protein n=1 Tax=Aphanomyces astaci TaxID=112090 RepID=A0A6A4YZ65_APHAT|nr:hypothetical protein AaE_015018 [Aphanomyces astaci]